MYTVCGRALQAENWPDNMQIKEQLVSSLEENEFKEEEIRSNLLPYLSWQKNIEAGTCIYWHILQVTDKIFNVSTACLSISFLKFLFLL